MINRVILTGRLTQDVELRRTNDGTPYVFFTIAVNRRQQDQTDFISCTAWRQTAELMNQYLNKGALIGVEGSLQVYSQQKDGQYETRTTVQVSTITFLESRAQANARTAEQSLNTQTVQQNEQPMTFADQPSFDQSQTTAAPQQQEQPAFGQQQEQPAFGQGQESVNPTDINLDEIKF